jgi:UDP-glucose 4-epimerase
MTILVTGGAGYIGSHVVRHLVDHNHAVTVYDNLSTGSEENIFPSTRFIRADIRDEAALDAAFQETKPEAVIHLAALKAAGESMVAPEKYAEHNIGGTIRILNAMSLHGVRLCVFSSSAAVYGEPQYLPIDENHPTEPANFYGFTKLEIERILKWYHTLRQIRSVSLRYFNAAGYDPDGRIPGREKNPANLLPVIMEVAAGIRSKLQVFGSDYDTFDGTCVRDYIHVSDLADAHLAALEYCAHHNECLSMNLGSETGHTVMEMIEWTRKITQQKIPLEITGRRAGDPARLVATSEFARKKIGWAPRFSTPEVIVKSTWSMYR